MLNRKSVLDLIKSTLVLEQGYRSLGGPGLQEAVPLTQASQIGSQVSL